MPRVFESVSGLRGIYPGSINPEYAFSAACRFSTYLSSGKIAVGMDTRRSSFALSRAVASGIMYAGCDAVTLGIVTTPELFHHVKSKGLDGGIMVTASHNPPEWNGLKLLKQGRGLFEDELKQVLANECKSRLTGNEKNESSADYYDEIEKALGSLVQGIRVALDLGGGSATLHVPDTFKRAGANVFALNAIPGIFTRGIDPTQDELQELKKLMMRIRCDVAFAFDCDGDRLQVVDSKGKKLPPDYTLYLAVKHARDVDKVVLSVDTSDLVFDIAKRRGMQVYISPVGEANVLKMMLEKDCMLGGEGSSAGVIDTRFSYCRDGLLASIYVIKEIAEENRLGVDVEGTGEVLRKKIELDEEVSSRVIKKIEAEYPDAIKLDGVKIRFEDGWCLIRKSRTEGILRISVEASSRKRAEELLEKFSKKVLELSKEV